MSNKRNSYFYLCVLVSLIYLVSSCSKTKTNQDFEASKNKSYVEYRDNALWKSLEITQKQLLTVCAEKENEGGATSDDLIVFKQSHLDRIIALRLVIFDPETRRYHLSKLGKDLLKENTK